MSEFKRTKVLQQHCEKLCNFFNLLLFLAFKAIDLLCQLKARVHGLILLLLKNFWALLDGAEMETRVFTLKIFPNLFFFVVVFSLYFFQHGFVIFREVRVVVKVFVLLRFDLIKIIDVQLADKR